MIDDILGGVLWLVLIGGVAAGSMMLNEGNWFGLPLVIGGCLAARDRVNER